MLGGSERTRAGPRHDPPNLAAPRPRDPTPPFCKTKPRGPTVRAMPNKAPTPSPLATATGGATAPTVTSSHPMTLDEAVNVLDAVHAMTPSSTPAERRAATNRANAQLSTGPRTAKGLARSSSNALVHGLSARSVVIRGESAERWEEFRDATVNDLAPVGHVEAQLAARAAELLWRLQRAGAAEAAVATFVHDTAEGEALAAALECLVIPPAAGVLGFAGARSLDALATIGERAGKAAELADDLANAIANGSVDLRAAVDGPVASALIRAMGKLAGGSRPVEMVHAAPGKRPHAPGGDPNAIKVGAWTLGAVKTAADDLAAHANTDPERARVWEGWMLLRAAAHACMDAAISSLQAVADARARVTLACELGAATEDGAAVRRHEAHLSRQLAATMALYDGARARRGVRPPTAPPGA